MKIPISDETLEVRWNPGPVTESGFATRDVAERFIAKICEPIALVKRYTIYNKFTPSKRKLESWENGETPQH